MPTDHEPVLRSAVTLLLRRPASSMDEIARAAGISRATLHRMFPGRPALITALGGEATAQISRAIDAADVDDDTADVPAVLRRLVDHVMPCAEYLAFLYGESSLTGDPELDAAWTLMDERVSALVRRGQENGSMRVDLTAQWVSEALFSFVAAAGWAVHEGRLARRDSARSVAELLLGGATRRPHR
ncbi:TetR/AcrR family transcriptional regulator [Streptomyces sp. SID3343]|uniref:TetR/AcrR family transcriptional regulator n=1 Tax=Streptomyces sp. SID3343 TaxID=2690260 RepID=UPI00136933A5|nr:TetR/AcrR family transcriptional regulator [Streptomyces sp. SID3343]MYV97984.1 TetR family transcriptional regulator [Streptomyces sp. SID3343]